MDKAYFREYRRVERAREEVEDRNYEQRRNKQNTYNHMRNVIKRLMDTEGLLYGAAKRKACEHMCEERSHLFEMAQWLYKKYINGGEEEKWTKSAYHRWNAEVYLKKVTVRLVERDGLEQEVAQRKAIVWIYKERQRLFEMAQWYKKKYLDS